MKSLITAAILGALTASPNAWAANNKNIVETAVSAGSFKTLAAALKAADLVAPLQGKGPFTVFAPTDEAFAKLPKGALKDLLKPENKAKLQEILKYHVIAGDVNLSEALTAKSAATLQGEKLNIQFNSGKVMVNDAGLINANLDTSNGIIHVIDKVLLPPTPKNDILSVAKKAGKFGTLLAAAEAAGLTDALSGSKPLTIFAPTDDAFQSFTMGKPEALLEPEYREKLKQILLYHVVQGEVTAADALKAGNAKTLGGEMVTFSIKNGLFKINDTTIYTTDIQCDNGVIHVIHSVLLPPTPKNDSAGVTKNVEAAKAMPDKLPEDFKLECRESLGMSPQRERRIEISRQAKPRPQGDYVFLWRDITKEDGLLSERRPDLQFSDQQILKFYQKAVEIGFFDLKESYLHEKRERFGNYTRTLTITANGVTKQVLVGAGMKVPEIDELVMEMFLTLRKAAK